MTFKCEHCGKEFPKNQKLERHLNRKFPCKEPANSVIDSGVLLLLLLCSKKLEKQREIEDSSVTDQKVFEEIPDKKIDADYLNKENKKWAEKFNKIRKNAYTPIYFNLIEEVFH